MKWHVKPPTEQNKIQKYHLHCGTNDINDYLEPQNKANEIVELAKSLIQDCNINVTVTGIVSRYGKLNEKVRFFNRFLRIYCRNMDIWTLCLP